MNVSLIQFNVIFSHSFLIENAASVYGEQKRLEPMPAERKAKWRKEIDWLLSVTDYVVEMVPTQQKSKDGSQMEVTLSLSLLDEDPLISHDVMRKCINRSP